MNQQPSNQVLLEKINNLHELVKSMNEKVDTKANKWVEKGAITILTAMILYFLGGLLGLFKIIPVSTAFHNILTLIA